MGIRIYYKGEELDNTVLFLSSLIISAVSLTFGIILKVAIWGV